MKLSSLSLYCCPVCRQGLAVAPEGLRREGGIVRTATLQCEGCARRYLVDGGIIRLLPEQGNLGEFKQREIDGWARRAESGQGQQIDTSLWTRLPYVDGLVPADGSDHWREAALTFPMVLALMEPLKGKRVLEIGSAIGWASYQMARLGAEVVATDLCEDSLRNAEYFFGQGAYFDRLCADAERLPLADASFDFVFCCAVIHHFEHPGALLREVARILRPGGRFMAINESYRPLLRSEQQMLNGSRVTRMHLDFGINEQVFTHRQYRRFFERAGLVFSAYHSRWDAAREDGRTVVEKNIGLKRSVYAISDLEKSRLRRLAHLIRIEKLIAGNALAAGLARQVLFHFTNSFRVLVGEKSRSGR